MHRGPRSRRTGRIGETPSENKRALHGRLLGRLPGVPGIRFIADLVAGSAAGPSRG